MKNKFVSSKYRGASNRLGPILENFQVRAFLNLELNIGIYNVTQYMVLFNKD